MALDKAGLVSALTAIFADLDAGATPASKAADIADAIDTYVKTGTVAFTAGEITGADSSGDTHGNLIASGGSIS